MDLELRQVRAFVTVVDEGSFTAAAEALHTSQASVSRAVASLERAVGSPVLHRTSRVVSLTSTGARVLGHARRLLEVAAALVDAAAVAPDEVRIGHAWAALGAHTVQVQQRWAAAHPGSDLRFVQVNSPTAGLLDGLVDLAVLRRPVEDDRLEQVLLGVEGRVAAVAADHPLAARGSIALGDLVGEVVAIDPRSGTTTAELWPPGEAGVRTRVVIGLDDWLTQIAAGQAVGITAEATARQHPRPGVAWLAVRDAPPIAVWIAWRRADAPSHAAEVVRLACDAYAAR